MLVFRERIGLDVDPRSIAGTIGKTFSPLLASVGTRLWMWGQCEHALVATCSAARTKPFDSGRTPSPDRTSDPQQRTRRKGSLFCAARRSRVGLLIQA